MLQRLLGVSLAWAVVLFALSSEASAASRYERVNAAISPYLGAMIDDPGTAHDASWAARTNRKLSRVARGASIGCRSQISKIKGAVSDLNLSAKAKRKRILRAAAPTYYRC